MSPGRPRQRLGREGPESRRGSRSLLKISFFFPLTPGRISDLVQGVEGSGFFWKRVQSALGAAEVEPIRQARRSARTSVSNHSPPGSGNSLHHARHRFPPSSQKRNAGNIPSPGSFSLPFRWNSGMFFHGSSLALSPTATWAAQEGTDVSQMRRVPRDGG